MKMMGGWRRLARLFLGDFVGGGLNRRAGADDQNHANSYGMAHRGRDHLRPDAGFVSTDRRHSIGIRRLRHDWFSRRPPVRVAQPGVHQTPSDTTDYNTVAGSVGVVVSKATLRAPSAWPTASAITYGPGRFVRKRRHDVGSRAPSPGRRPR